jgi:competence protein ComEC
MKKSLKIYFLVFLCIFNLVVWTVFWESSRDDMVVSFLDIGQGDAIFVRTPTGHQMLIDSGAPGGSVLRELGRVMPFYDRSIDVVLATHPDQDHIGGLTDVLERFSVGLYIHNLSTSSSEAFTSLVETIQKKDINVLVLTEPTMIDFGDGARFEIIFPDQDIAGWDSNEASITGKLIYGKHSVLLTGDLSIIMEKYLIDKYGEYLKSDILKAGHHGSKHSTSLLFAEKVSPRYAVISASQKNTYGHPAPEVLDNLKKVGAEIWATLGSGRVEFGLDYDTIRLSRAKNKID